MTRPLSILLLTLLLIGSLVAATNTTISRVATEPTRTTGGIQVSTGDITGDSTEQTTNFGVLLGDEPEEESEGADLLERLVLREDNLEGVFLLIKTDDEFKIIELPRKTTSPYFVGSSNGGVWKVAQMTEESAVKYGPVITIKPKGAAESGGAEAMQDVFITEHANEGIEPDDIDSNTEEEAVGLLLPAIQKVREARSDEEALAMLLPAVQKVRESAAKPGIEPDEIDVALEQEGIEPDEIDVSLEVEERGFFARLFSFFGN